MKALIVLLALAWSRQQNRPETVALVFGPEPTRIEFANRAESERLYSAIKLKIEKETATAEDLRLFAALTQALGVRTTQDDRVFTPQDKERFRWMRESIQNPRRPK